MILWARKLWAQETCSGNMHHQQLLPTVEKQTFWCFALSCQFSVLDSPMAQPHSILYNLGNKLDPDSGTPYRFFIPLSTRSQLLHWEATAKFTCHPRFQRTLTFPQRLFWWPSLVKDLQSMWERVLKTEHKITNTLFTSSWITETLTCTWAAVVPHLIGFHQQASLCIM